jgi:hypothetical protein
LSTIRIGNNNTSKDNINNNDAPDEEDANAPEKNHKEIMAFKAKLSAVPKAVPTKKPPTKVAPPAARRHTIVLYSLDVRDAAVIAYYNDKGINYAKVEVHINSVIPPGMSRFLLAEDGMSVSWQQAMDWRCFLKEHLHSVMRGKFSTSHSCVIAYCDMVQAMKCNKMIPDGGGLYWGTPQVIRLNQHCTRTPTTGSTPTHAAQDHGQ